MALRNGKWMALSVAASLCGLGLVTAGSAGAHGPSRLKVELEMDIAAPPAKVWQRIGNFQDMSWHPAVAATTGSGGNATEATRVLELKGEGKPTIAEALRKHDDAGRSYSYKITHVDVAVLPVSNYTSSITVEDAGEGKSKVLWKGAFYRGFPGNDPPAAQNDDAAEAAVTGIYRSGLEALKATMEQGKQ